MTYPPAPNPYTPIPPRPATRPGGLAVSSLVLGIVGVVLSFMPLINNLTAAGAVVGFVLGFIGIFRSRQVMSGFGVVLCAVAVILTVVAQTQLGEKLDQIGAGLDGATSTSTSVEDAAPAADTPITTREGYAPAPGDFHLAVVEMEKKCFGSAGCLVTFRVEVTYLGATLPDPSKTFTAIYDVTGGDEPMTNRFTITGSEVSVPSEEMIQTGGPNAVLTATVTRTM